MRYFKYIILGLMLISSSQNCFAQDWIMVQSSAPNIVYLDRDSINYHNDSLYYNIKLITYSSGNEGIYSTIQSKGDTAGIVQSFKGGNYQTHAKALTPKTAALLKPLTEKSLLYQTNKRAWSIYNSNNIDVQAQGERPSIDETKLDFAPFMKDVRRRIKKNWKPPKGSETKQVVLLFTIAKDGRLLDNRILTTSGDKDFDDCALRTVEMTAPFEHFPQEYKKQSVDIQFTFNYNIFGKGK